MMNQKIEIRKYVFALTIFLGLTMIINTAFGQGVGFPNTMYTKAERTNYLETSLHSDVMNFVNALVENSELANLEIIGTSLGGREIPLVIIADPPVSTPEEAEASGKLVLYVQANIHAGEVEGKETCMEIMREIVFGPKRRLLENQILLFCPIYNTDGNDALSPNNRRSQEGSPIEAGERYSGEGYDLNRDGLKIDAIETKAMMQNVMNKWNPLVFVDLHTTNGTWHGYSITYAAGSHTVGHPGTFNFLMDELFPAITDRVKERSGFDTFLYGGFNNYPPTIYDFGSGLYMPRFLWNSMALKNKLGILVETFAHDRFEKRILSNNAFLTSLFEYTSDHYLFIQNLINNINDDVIEEINSLGGQFQRGLGFKTVDRGDPADLLVYEVIGGNRTGKRIWRSNVRMLHNHEATKLSTVPKGYIFPAQLSNVADKLIEHGVDVDILESAATFEGEEFTVTNYYHDNNSYQKHYRTRISGNFQAGNKQMPAGSFYVNMAQPYAYLIFYMLEPESDDGLVLWNFFDDYLENTGVESRDVPFPVFKVLTGGASIIPDVEMNLEFRVFPNPVNDKITVEFNKEYSGQLIIELLNVDGKILINETIEDGMKTRELDLSSYPEGTYFVRVGSNDISGVRKILKR